MFERIFSSNFVRYLILIVVALLFLLPIFWMVSTSFKPLNEKIFSYPPQLIPENVTIDNYVQAMDLIDISRTTFNSFFIAISTVILNLFLCSLTAYPLARMDFAGKNVILLAILATFMIPLEAIIVPLFILVQNLGLVNSYAAVILPSAITAFGIFLLRNSFTSIPKELEEAARIDGCSEFKIYYKIMLPMVKPSMAALAILQFVTAWNHFLWPMIVLRNVEIQTLQIRLVKLGRGLFGADWRVLSATACLVAVPVVVFFLVFQKYFTSGITDGAVKQ